MANTRGSQWQGQNNPGALRRQALWRAIEEEFDEPLTDVILGLREQGNSWRTVAGALGTSYSVLQEWRHVLGLPINRLDKIYDPSSCPAVRASDVKAQAFGYPDAPTAIADLRANHGLTLKQIGERLGIHYAYISKLSPASVKGIHNTSTQGHAVHCRQLEHVARGGPDHPWSKDNDIVFAYAKAKV